MISEHLSMVIVLADSYFINPIPSCTCVPGSELCPCEVRSVDRVQASREELSVGGGVLDRLCPGSGETRRGA